MEAGFRCGSGVKVFAQYTTQYILVTQIKEINIVKNFKVYKTTNICKDFANLRKQSTDIVSNNEAQTSQVLTNDTKH